MGWLTGWAWRKSHEIIGSSAGAVTDYQIRITVHYGAGTDSGEHVYLNGKCKSDFSDVRFTDSDGETELSYWRETYVDSDYAVFWVKIPNIPTHPNTATIYIYYGNSSAIYTGSVAATFIREIDGLVGAWHFDEETGTVVYDSSGNGNDGTTDAIRTTGKFGNALSYNGSTNTQIPSSADLQFGGSDQFSVCGWFKLNTLPSSVEKNYGICGIVTDFLVRVDPPTDYIHFWVYDGTDWEPRTSGDYPLQVNVWYFFTAVYDGEIGKLNLYLNGALYGSSNNTADAPTTNPLNIGYPQPSHQGIDGIIDEIFYFKRALTEAEHTDLYNNYGYTTTNYPGKVLVRKYVDPEPTNSTWGSEAQITDYVIIRALDLFKIKATDVKFTRSINNFSELEFETIDDLNVDDELRLYYDGNLIFTGKVKEIEEDIFTGVKRVKAKEKAYELTERIIRSQYTSTDARIILDDILSVFTWMDTSTLAASYPAISVDF